MPSKITTTTPQATGSGTPQQRPAVAQRRTAADLASANTSALLRAREMPGFAFGHDRTDIRGWQVYSNDAELVGAVGSIFVDMHTKAVRYLGVLLDNSSAKAAGEVLVPVGSVSRPDDRQVVVVNALSAAQLSSAPRISKRATTRNDENAALAAYGMATWRDAQASDLYSGPNFEEQRLFGTSGADTPVS